MSDLSATNCGCERGGFSPLMLILLLCCCNGGNTFNGNGCGMDNCMLIMLLLFCCGGNICG